MQPIIFKPNQFKTFLYVLLDLAFLIPTIYLVFFADLRESQTTNKYVVGTFVLIFFGFGLIVLLYKLFANKPILVIDDKGLYMPEVLLTTNRVAWEDITEFSIIQIQNQEFISVVVKDQEKYMPKNSKLRQKIYEMNESGQSYAAHIPTYFLKDMSTEELLDLLNQLLEKYGKK